MLFFLLATVAVGGLASGDPGAEAWLRRVLLEVVLAPAYLLILHHEKNPANVVSAGFSVE